MDIIIGRKACPLSDEGPRALAEDVAARRGLWPRLQHQHHPGLELSLSPGLDHPVLSLRRAS